MKRLFFALFAALAALAGYFFSTERVVNPITEETQRVGLTIEQEIALGLQAAPRMVELHHGLDPDPEDQAVVDAVGDRLVSQSVAGETAFAFDFHLLADDETINAFALPGGQIFLTAGLFEALETEAQVAGVLAHEIGHVVARHSAEQMAKARLTQGLTGAAVIAAYDPNRPATGAAAQVAALIGQAVHMKYGREDELESDRLAVRFLVEAGYDPEALVRVMEILAAAGDGRRMPEFFSTHPNPQRRIEQIHRAIEQRYASGLARRHRR